MNMQDLLQMFMFMYMYTLEFKCVRLQYCIHHRKSCPVIAVKKGRFCCIHHGKSCPVFRVLPPVHYMHVHYSHLQTQWAAPWRGSM